MALMMQARPLVLMLNEATMTKQHSRLGFEIRWMLFADSALDSAEQQIQPMLL
jgi:hypothetical protein